MKGMIHKTVTISKTANIDPSVEIGPYSIIGENVIIKKNTVIGPYTFIEHSEIGENCKISNHVSLGNPGQDVKYKGQKTKVVVGNNCIIREFATIHRGSITEMTRVGNDCFLMAYSHVGHDSRIGNGVVMANCASLGGHVVIEDRAIIGALAGMHQFARVGRLSILGGGTIASQDVIPYTMSHGNHSKLYGLNRIGLVRAGFSKQTIDNIKYAYRTLFHSKLPFQKALSILEGEVKQLGPEVKHMLDFIRTTQRGICHPPKK